MHGVIRTMKEILKKRAKRIDYLQNKIYRLTRKLKTRNAYFYKELQDAEVKVNILKQLRDERYLPPIISIMVQRAK